MWEALEFPFLRPRWNQVNISKTFRVHLNNEIFEVMKTDRQT